MTDENRDSGGPQCGLRKCPEQGNQAHDTKQIQSGNQFRDFAPFACVSRCVLKPARPTSCEIPAAVVLVMGSVRNWELEFPPVLARAQVRQALEQSPKVRAVFVAHAPADLLDRRIAFLKQRFGAVDT